MSPYLGLSFSRRLSARSASSLYFSAIASIVCLASGSVSCLATSRASAPSVRHRAGRSISDGILAGPRGALVPSTSDRVLSSGGGGGGRGRPRDTSAIYLIQGFPSSRITARPSTTGNLPLRQRRRARRSCLTGRGRGVTSCAWSRSAWSGTDNTVARVAAACSCRRA